MKLFKSLFVLALLFTFTAGCGMVVDAGHRGVKKVWGEVEPNALTEGFYFYNPFSTDIEELSVRESKYASKTESYTNDTQNVELSYEVNWRPEIGFITSLYKDKGADYANVLMPQVVNKSIKEVIGQYKAVALISEREKANEEIRTKIAEKLVKKNIIIADFAVTNLQFNKEFEDAVEAKVVAKERAKEELNRTVQVREQAKQTLISAEAQAKSMRIMANALQANPKLVQYEAVKKWNGVMPVMSGGGTPLVDVSKFLNAKK